MNKSVFDLTENYMKSCMSDTAHDKEHVYRVLYNALEIAKTEKDVDYDVLICACLLHDIGRKEQFENPSLDHAEVGGDKAYKFLTDVGFADGFATRVRECIISHRFRKDSWPRSTEAKILFDADKLDVTGAMGIARTLVYKGGIGDPLYTVKLDGTVSDGNGDENASFFQEYHYKLKNLYSRFYTERGREIAESRRHTATAFYGAMLKEVNDSYDYGRAELSKLID